MLSEMQKERKKEKKKERKTPEAMENIHVHVHVHVTRAAMNIRSLFWYLNVTSLEMSHDIISKRIFGYLLIKLNEYSNFKKYYSLQT